MVTDTNDPVPRHRHGAGADTDRDLGTSHRRSGTRTWTNLMARHRNGATHRNGPRAPRTRKESHAPSPVVDVDGLTVTHGDVTAVRDLTFHVQQGELYALLGTNGAGKTSALEVIGGRRRETSGTVRVFGRDPLGGRATRPRTGIMLAHQPPRR